jgi:hypothetical protein
MAEPGLFNPLRQQTRLAKALSACGVISGPIQSSFPRPLCVNAGRSREVAAWPYIDRGSSANASDRI